LFFPAEVAVVATALVHGANNVFKVAVLGRNANRQVVVRFGIPAIVFAVVGALALGWLSGSASSYDYDLLGRTARITPVKLIIGVLMLVFAAFELAPRLKSFQFDRKYLPLGGMLSGFFGGLSGHQGALRSAFLAKTGLDTSQFVGSNAVIGLLVDATRILAYAGLMAAAGGRLAESGQWPLVVIGAAAAFGGVLLGKRFVHKITMSAVQNLVGVLLILVALAMMSGVI
jgi:uncharacterized membrane protein YfcA